MKTVVKPYEDNFTAKNSGFSGSSQHYEQKFISLAKYVVSLFSDKTSPIDLARVASSKPIVPLRLE